LKYIFITIFSILSIDVNAQDNPEKYRYFTIYVNVEDAEFFKSILDVAGLSDNPDYNKQYQLVVNLISEDKWGKFVVIVKYDSPDADKDPKALRYAWEQFTQEDRNSIINWTGKNKINREKKL